mgnify:CR=1 FL=1
MPVIAEVDMTFSERLHDLKDARGLSWNEIARRAGLSMNSMNDYAHRGKVPSAIVLFKLAEGIGVSCDSFKLQARTPRLQPA